MSGYYKTIKGKKYDGALIDLADKCTAGRGDGRLSLADAKKILKAVKDSATYSELEKKTMQHIRDHYKFTPESNAWFRTEIRRWAATKDGAAPVKKKPVRAAKKPAARKQPTGEEEFASLLDRAAPAKPAAKPAVKKSRLWLWIIIILLVIAVVLAVLYCPCVKKFCPRKAAERTGGVIPPTPVIVVPSEKPAEPLVPAKEDPCIYVVQPKDSLISIAEQKLGDYRKWEKIYNDNKSQIGRPSMIFTGQRLKVGCNE
jgi:nucleoid-associated protein YgaU